MRPGGLVRKLDCIQVPVPDLASGLAFYRDAVGLEVAWRSADAIGLHLPDDDAEIVIQTARPEPEADLLVDDVLDAVREWVDVGGTVEVEPFEIQIGRCAVVRDPFGNRHVLVDMTRGPLPPDASG